MSDASTALAGLEQARRRSRRYMRDSGLGRPLIAWGIAWIVGAVALKVLPPGWGSVLGISVCVAAAGVSWFGRRREVVRGFEQRFAACWWVLLACSPVLVVVVAPPDRDVLVLFLCCQWALGMLLYGIGASDHPLAAVGGFTLLLSGSARLAIPGSAMIVVGVASGLALVLVGWWRLRVAR